jgi:hypothetical protein
MLASSATSSLGPADSRFFFRMAAARRIESDSPGSASFTISARFSCASQSNP